MASVRLKKVLIKLLACNDEHVRRRVVNSNIFDKVIVASGDDEILNIVKSNGGSAIKTFKKHKNGTSKSQNLLKTLTTLVMIVQGDEPLVKEHLYKMSKEIEKNPLIDAWNSISKIKDPSDLESKYSKSIN